MRFNKPVDVKWIAEYIGAKIIGDDSIVALGLNEIIDKCFLNFFSFFCHTTLKVNCLLFSLVF
jgi:predicted transcriptional regulator with HTH domain